MIKTELKLNQFNSELVNEDFEDKLTIAELQRLIDNYPESSFARIYNDRMFEDGNFIMRINSDWYLWNEHEERLENWCWDDDMKKIIDISDPEEIEEFNASWSLLSTDVLDRGGEGFFENVVVGLNQNYPEYISKEFMRMVLRAEGTIDEIIKSMIKNCDGSEQSLNDTVAGIKKIFIVEPKFVHDNNSNKSSLKNKEKP